ncbi:Imm1 family immunity protein [Streptomyces eurythermus]
MAVKVFDREPFYLTTASETQEYLDRIFTEEKQEGYLSVDFQIIRNDEAVMDNILGVGLDYTSGYGALLWYCDGEFSEEVAAVSGAEVAEHVWVSRNPSPPEADPRVVCDPWSPSYFNRVSVIALDGVRPVVEEYFRESTGLRPAGVEWVKGHFTGELYEENEWT